MSDAASILSVRRASAAVVRDGTILMVRYRTYWILPGGGIEDGEAPEEAAVRELAEETGLEGRATRLLYDVVHDGGRRDLCFLMEEDGARAPVLGHDPQFAPEAQNLNAIEWFPLEEMRDHFQVSLVIAGLGSL